MDTELERQKRPGPTACLLIASLVNAACGTSATGPTAVAPTVNLTGRYLLTLRPSPSCVTFLDSSRTFRFAAALNQQDSMLSLEVQVTLGGVQYPVTLHGNVHDRELGFRTADCGGCSCEAFASDVSPDETFGMCGASAASIANPLHITGVFTGTLEYYRVDGTGRVVMSTACSAPDHAFTLDAV
jgi:hypothetical protein